MEFETLELIDNTAAHHLELPVVGYTSFIDYKRTGHNLFLIHTEVPDALEGKGVGSAIVKKAFQFAEKNGLAVVPLCSFVQVYLNRHPEWKRIVAKDAGRFMQNDEDDE